MLQVKGGWSFQTHSPAVREDIRVSVVAEAKRRDCGASVDGIETLLWKLANAACELNTVKC